MVDTQEHQEAEESIFTGAIISSGVSEPPEPELFSDEFYDYAMQTCDEKIKQHKSAIRELKESKASFEWLKKSGFRSKH